MKTYVVIGVGKFGSVLVNELIKSNSNLICIDKNKNSFKNLTHIPENCVIADASNIEILKQSGVTQADTAIISLGDNNQSAILSLMALKELGVKEIIVKAEDTTYGQIYSKLGANKVIYPNRDIALNLANDLLAHPNYTIFNITTSMKILKLHIDSKLAEKKISDFNQNVSVIAHKNENKWTQHPNELNTLKIRDTLIIIGTKEEIDKFIKKYEI
ncbi:TrkA family potassium uptake protein [Campylobacter sp. FMV-PI01]|uniref:TrkA family potassium uptake protein n=1 Tax=Campylobacter portucalensis TaxID=2608384 RepID=A0A6L5WJC0_9BACT|nr:TrkA family potassium uptake protein [Campylobacter portucalensis]MSN95821.1 TrkA family potassium uptake protein [Campylobacter portucalensis]